MSWRTWRQAATDALYGTHGFYRRPEGPAGHFRTSVHVSDLYAAALADLARAAGLTSLVDVGAGRGELAAACGRVAPDLTVVSVEVAHPGFATEVPLGVEALVVANEWLDNVPVDVVEHTAEGPRLVEVDPEGTERPGPPPDDDDLRWLERWWPLAEEGHRAEVGRPRDAAWAAVVRRVSRGVVVAVDYGHTADARPAYGTLTGYRDGQQVTPVPDGSCDLTAHLAVDACAAAGESAGAGPTLVTTQRDALRALGVNGRLPPIGLATGDPTGYVHALSAASEAGELLDPGGLGSFSWLVQAVGVDLPEVLRY